MKIFEIRRPRPADLPSGCYVYAYEIEGVVRYIGKGRTDRAWDHVYAARSASRRRAFHEAVKPNYFRDRLGNCLKRKQAIRIIVLRDAMTDAEALALEITEIAAAPLGQLWNFTDGGEGLTSAKALSVNSCPIKRARASRTLRIVMATPEVKARHSASLRAAFASPEAKQRLSNAQKKKWTPDRRRDHAEKMRRYWSTASVERISQQASIGRSSIAKINNRD